MVDLSYILSLIILTFDAVRYVSIVKKELN
jgi:hypothetical protein